MYVILLAKSLTKMREYAEFFLTPVSFLVSQFLSHVDLTLF